MGNYIVKRLGCFVTTEVITESTLTLQECKESCHEHAYAAIRVGQTICNNYEYIPAKSIISIKLFLCTQVNLIHTQNLKVNFNYVLFHIRK